MKLKDLHPGGIVACYLCKKKLDWKEAVLVTSYMVASVRELSATPRYKCGDTRSCESRRWRNGQQPTWPPRLNGDRTQCSTD